MPPRRLNILSMKDPEGQEFSHHSGTNEQPVAAVGGNTTNECEELRTIGKFFERVFLEQVEEPSFLQHHRQNIKIPLYKNDFDEANWFDEGEAHYLTFTANWLVNYGSTALRFCRFQLGTFFFFRWEKLSFRLRGREMKLSFCEWEWKYKNCEDNTSLINKYECESEFVEINTVVCSRLMTNLIFNHQVEQTAASMK